MADVTTTENKDTDEQDNNHPELIKQTDDLYFSLQNNISQEAKNTYAHFMNLVREEYKDSMHKNKWNDLLNQMQAAINDFENKLSDESEMQFYGIYHNGLDLRTRSHSGK